jgi:hypothetical protein
VAAGRCQKYYCLVMLQKQFFIDMIHHQLSRVYKKQLFAASCADKTHEQWSYHGFIVHGFSSMNSEVCLYCFGRTSPVQS